MALPVNIPVNILNWLIANGAKVEHENFIYVMLPVCVRIAQTKGNVVRTDFIRLDDVPEEVKQNFKKIKI